MKTLAILATASLLLLAGCGDGGESSDDDRLSVVATTGQIGDLVRNVGGDHVRVTVLMGPGIDPHQYKATAGDVERLRTADLIVTNGLHLEAKMGEVLERLGARQPTLAAAEAIPTAELIAPPDDPGAHDPHVWFDVGLWRHVLDAVADKLCVTDPEHADDYRAGATAYRRELDALDDECRRRFAAVPPERRILVTAHDAFGYLGRAYGLEVIGLQGISTASEAGTGDVQDLAALIAERRVPAIFVESSVSPRAIEAVREAVRSRGFDVRLGGELFSDALGDPGTAAGTYLGMVKENVDTITAALGGEVDHEH